MPTWLRLAALMAVCLVAACTDQVDSARPTFKTTVEPNDVNEAYALLHAEYPFETEEIQEACAYFAAHEWSYIDAWTAANRESLDAGNDMVYNRIGGIVTAIDVVVQGVVVPTDDVLNIVELRETGIPFKSTHSWTKADHARYEAAIATKQRGVTQAFCAE